MTVTAIEEISKTRSRVFLDETFAFVLYKGELHKYQIVEGEEMPEETWQELQNVVLPKRAKLRAMNLLQKKQYTEKQLFDKLILGGYTEELAQVALDYVKAYRYIDDERYAEEYIRVHAERYSRKEIERKLIQKGISKEKIVQAIEQCTEQNDLPDEKILIQKHLEKKQLIGKQPDEKEKQRLYGFLYRKGFSQEAIRWALRQTE